MKIFYFFAVLFISPAVMVAADIQLQTPTTTTGTISGEKGEFYLSISNGDTVSGPGNGYHVSHEALHHCELMLESLSPQKRKTIEEELTKRAASGQPATLRGEFVPIRPRGEEKHRIDFDVKELIR
jgi:hypothetical protein